MVARENKNNAYAKILESKQRVLWSINVILAYSRRAGRVQVEVYIFELRISKDFPSEDLCF